MKKLIALVTAIILIVLLSATCFAQSPSETVYTDVSRSTWCYDAVSTLSKSGVLNGFGENDKFNPNSFLTLQEMQCILCREYGISPIDAKTSLDGTEFLTMEYIVQQGIEAENVTRETACSNLLFVLGIDKGISAIKTCERLGLVNGDGSGNLRPSDYITRAEFCQLVYNQSLI